MSSIFRGYTQILNFTPNRYKMEVNQVYQGDSAEMMKKLPDNFIDLTVTSPPYDNLRDYKGYSFDFETIAKELYRVTKDGGVVVWVVGDSTIDGSETGTSFKQALFFMECGFNLHDTMIYEKNSMSMPDTVRYYQVFEYMFVFSKGKPQHLNLLADKKNRWAGSKNFGERSQRNKDGSLKKNGSSVVKEYGIRNNIWRYNTGAGYTTTEKYAFEHPAMFPEALAKDHILSWSNKGDLVFDPFAGSGTTLKMAQLMGRNYLGFEIAEEYITLINKRLRQKPIDHFLSYSSEANASSSANAESLIGIKRKPCEVSQSLLTQTFS